MNLRSGYHACRSTPFSIAAFTFAVIGCVSLIIALSSPEWLESKPESNSNFVRLGLWKVCFRQYQHPSLKFDGFFNGCYPLHGHKSESIRNWLQPGIILLLRYCLRYFLFKYKINFDMYFNVYLIYKLYLLALLSDFFHH